MPDKLKPVKSSSIAAYSYNSQDKTLLVQFKSGTQYEYKDINPDLMSSVFDRAGSTGRLFQRLIGSKKSGTKVT